MMLEVAGLDAFYGEQPGAVRDRFRRRRGQVAPCWAPTAPARRRCCARSAAWCARAAKSASTASSIAGWATEDIVRLGIAHVPEGRGTFLRVTRRGELAARRDDPPRPRRASPPDIEAGLRPFPAAQGAPRAAGRDLVRRRTADAGGRPRADAAAAPDAARRAVLRPGAADRRGTVRDPAPGQSRDGRRDADRRAERGPGARTGRARLSARNRPHRDGRAGRGDRRRRRRSAAPISAIRAAWNCCCSRCMAGLANGRDLCLHGARRW